MVPYTLSQSTLSLWLLPCFAVCGLMTVSLNSIKLPPDYVFRHPLPGGSLLGLRRQRRSLRSTWPGKGCLMTWWP